MANRIAMKAAVDVAITNKVAINSISTADVGGQLKAIIDQLRPYKVYTALLNQAGSLVAPTVTVLENTLDEALTPDVSDDGQFSLVSSSPGTLPVGKTWVSASTGNFTASGFVLNAFLGGAGFIALYNLDSNGGYVNGMVNSSIEIRVYP